MLLSGGADPGISTRVVDVLASLALDREASRRLRAALGETRTVPAVEVYPTDVQAAPDGERSARDVQAAIRVQREFLRSGYDVA